MRRYLQAALAAAILVAVGILVGDAAFGRAPVPPSVVSLDDGYKTPLVLHASLSVPNGDATEAPVGTAIAAGKRFVIESISIRGQGSGPATQDQGIERVDVRNGTWTLSNATWSLSDVNWTLSLPLDRYSWGSCPGSGDCTGVDRYWQYGATQAVRAYADPGSQVTVMAWHPGIPTGEQPPAQTLSVDVLGYLVNLS